MKVSYPLDILKKNLVFTSRDNYEKAIKDLSKPLDEGQIATLNELAEGFGIKPLTKGIMADLANLKACVASVNACKSCKDKLRRNCFRYRPRLETSGRIIVDKHSCQINRVNEIIRNSGVPAIFQSMTFYQYGVDGARIDAVNTAKSCVTGENGMYIYGRAGVGKTKLASAVVVERAKLLRTTIFKGISDLLEACSSYGDKLRRDENIDKFKNCTCLIIDDIGAENVSSWSTSVIFDILDYRYRACSLTAMTSNYSPDELKKLYGESGDRIVRRIKELCTVARIIG